MKRLLIALLAFTAACAGHPDPRYLTHKQLGDKWPFTVESVTVNADGPVYTVETLDGTVYALNGTADSQKDEEGRPKYQPLEAIWIRQDAAPGVPGRKDLTPITDVAEACEKGTI